MRRSNIRIIEVESEIGAGTRGSSLGPSALKLTDLSKGRKKLSKYPSSKVPTRNEALARNFPAQFAKNIDAIAHTLPLIAEQVEDTLLSDQFPLVLSGDHSNAAGTIAGIKNHFPDKRLGVIWIDAHADLHSPYTTPSGNIHGMPLAASLGIDNEKDAINEPDETTLKFWNELKYCGSRKICPKILPSDLVFIDIRDLEDQEWDLIDDLDIEFYTPKEIKEFGIERVAKESIDYLKDCDFIYVSFDVDSLDPSVSRGTGTPYPDGLKLHEAKTLLYHLLKNPKTICLEITEINPLLDKENAMAKAVLEILEEVI